MGAIRRVLQVHTRYRQAGGEDRVVESERQLLESAGIEVRQVLFDNADLRESRSAAGDLQLALSAIWSGAARARVQAELGTFRPQIMHVHNTFAAASPSVHSAARPLGIPVVQTLHNYRLFCPAATAFRDGHACTDCVGRIVPWPAVVHRCVRGSAAQSAVVAAMLTTHRAMGTWRRSVAASIALTAFQRDLLVAGGLPRQRFHVIPNFLEPDPGTGSVPRSGVLFVGRLSTEKGIVPLLDAARRQPGIVRVAGTGPLDAEVAAAAASGLVEQLGALAGPEVTSQMQRSAAVVLPSICFEGFPMVVLEAYATGTPVIASRIGSLAEVVEDGVTGLLLAPSDAGALAERIGWAVEHPDEMRRLGVQARARYEERYRGATHLAALLEAYELAATPRSKRRADA